MLRRVPNKGTGYGLLTHIGELRHKEPEVSFNYLGQFSEEKEADTFELSYYQPRHEIAGEREREYEPGHQCSHYGRTASSKSGIHPGVQQALN